MSRQPYTLPTKVCADCFADLPVACFPMRKQTGKPDYLESTCLECTRRRWRAANRLSRSRRAAGVIPPKRAKAPPRARVRNADAPKPPYTPKPCPYALPSVGVQRHAPVRWSIGVRA